MKTIYVIQKFTIRVKINPSHVYDRFTIHLFQLNLKRSLNDKESGNQLEDQED